METPEPGSGGGAAGPLGFVRALSTAGRRGCVSTGRSVTISAMALSRRELLWGAGVAGLGLACRRSPQVQVGRIAVPRGVAAGDVSGDRAVIWSQSDRPGQLLVEWDTSARFAAPRRVVGPTVTAASAFTGIVELTGLPAGQTVSYRVTFVDGRDASAPIVGRFATPPPAGATWRFAWSGDTCGQGYGRNPDHGGLRIYQAIAAAEPRFFLNSGDLIYADNPIPPSITLPDGRVWRNQTDETLARVAESLDDFRHRFAYNLDDPHLQGFLAGCPVIAQWDDHETRNNWYPGQQLDDPRYRERDASTLAARARQALFEFTPIARGAAGLAAPIQRVHPLRPRPRRDRGRPAQLPHRQRSQPRRRRPGRHARRRPGPVAGRGPGELARDLEDRRLRSAGRPGHPRRRWRRSGPRGLAPGRRRPAARPRARAGLGPGRAPPARGGERRVADRRRPLCGRPPLRPGPRPGRPVHAVLGVRGGAAPRRQLRAEPPRPDLWARGPLRVGPAARHRQPGAVGRPAVFRDRRARRASRGP
jgi:hypothetical protein